MTTTKQKKAEPTAKPGSIQGTVDARAFTDRLKALKRHTGRHVSIPVLNYIRLRWNDFDNVLRIHYTGLDMEMATSIPGEGTGDVVVPVHTLAGFMVPASGTGSTVEIVKEEADSHVTFRCGPYELKVAPLPVEDVPTFWTPDVYTRAFVLGEGVMDHILAMTRPFVSTEETRYYLNGIAFECQENRIQAVATNGHMLGTRSAGTPAPLEPWEHVSIVHNEAVAAVADLIGKHEVTARFYAEFAPPKEAITTQGVIKVGGGWHKQRCSFSSKNWTINAKLIDGTFPQWRRVVPGSEPDDAVLSFEALEVSRFAKMMGSAYPKGHGVKLTATETGIRLHGGDTLDGGEMSADIAATKDGTFLEPLVLNFRLFAKVAAALGTKKVEMRVRKADKHAAFVFRGDGAGSDEFAVLMPMRV